MQKTLRRGTLVAAFVLAPLSSIAAQEAPPPTEAARLVEELKRQILEELRKGDFLREQIALGIKEYFQKEQAAQAVAAAEKTRLAQERVRAVRPLSPGRDHVYGSPDAPISLIEYSDYECPFCKRFHTTPKQIVDASAGRVNWVYRHFPLAMHNPGAQKQAEAAECVNELGGGDAFWKYTDAIYARTRSNGSGFPLGQLAPLAVEIGLQAGAFQQCLDSGRHVARVQEDFAEGVKIGVTGTPTTVLRHNRTGEVRLKTGAQAAAAFTTDIEAMLK